MSVVSFEIVFILLLLVANGVFAMSEMAVVSARKARLQQRANIGSAKALAALELANSPTHFLSTVQIGITLVGILAGAFGGATLSEHLTAYVSRVPPLAPYSEAISLGFVVLCITYLSLVIGELVPKRIALHNPERIASAVAIPMRALSTIASPVARLLSASTEGVLRVFGIKESDEPPVTQEEIKLLIEQGIGAGIFEKSERDIVERVFHLGDREVGELMTPRTEIVWFDIDAPAEVIREKIISSNHSRFPIAQGSLDRVLGIVRAKDLLAQTFAGKPTDLRALLRKPLFVPEVMPALRAVEEFKKSGIHSALVVDEHGGLEGIVTINDILEAIVGDITSADEPHRQQVAQREDGSWLVDGGMAVDEFKELFQLNRLPKEDQVYYRTMGGLIMAHLGRIPSVADSFDWGGFRFEVADMDGNRVDKVLVIPITDGAPPPKGKH